GRRNPSSRLHSRRRLPATGCRRSARARSAPWPGQETPASPPPLRLRRNVGFARWPLPKVAALAGPASGRPFAGQGAGTPPRQQSDGAEALRSGARRPDATRVAAATDRCVPRARPMAACPCRPQARRPGAWTYIADGGHSHGKQPEIHRAQPGAAGADRVRRRGLRRAEEGPDPVRDGRDVGPVRRQRRRPAAGGRAQGAGDRRRQLRQPPAVDEAAGGGQGPQHPDRRGRAGGRHHLRKHGRLLAGRGRAQGRAAGQAAGSAHPAGESGHLHGRQGRRREPDRAGDPRPGAAAGPDVRCQAGRGRERGVIEMATEQLADTGAAAEAKTLDAGDFASLLNKEFKPKSDRAKEEVETAVRTLAEQVLSRADVVSDDVSQTIKAYIAEIDRKLTEQLNHVMHAAEFQQVESAWRGLHYLVNNTETDQQLKIRV